MMEAYIGILRDGSSELVEKKSRFIGAAKAVYDESEATAFVESQRRLYPDARHHVYAYRVGRTLERYSDDGEPGGTGGLPVLSVLKHASIENAAIVVTRYFGGTLLGTGGLVHAYGHTAKAAVEDALIAVKRPHAKFSIKTEYAAAGKIKYEVMETGGIIADTLYTDIVEFTVIWPPDARALSEFVADATGGKALTSLAGEVYCAELDGHIHIFTR